MGSLEPTVASVRRKMGVCQSEDPTPAFLVSGARHSRDTKVSVTLCFSSEGVLKQNHELDVSTKNTLKDVILFLRGEGLRCWWENRAQLNRTDFPSDTVFVVALTPPGVQGSSEPG